MGTQPRIFVMDAAPKTEEITSASQLDPDILVLDSQTLKDLEIFATDGSGQSLFQFCNLTGTGGGAKVLQRRMQRPWSNAECILATQASLSFILDHRDCFTKLVSLEYASGRVDHYAHEVLPLIIHENALAFGIDACALWTNGGSHYDSIVRGVQISCRLFNDLKHFVGQADLASIVGELAPLVEEMRGLLEKPIFASLPSGKFEAKGWRTLRIDQLFRLHEKSTILRLLELIYEIDALVAMADAGRKYNFIKPQLLTGSPQVRAEGLVHPFVSDAKANPVLLDESHRVLFLTGPNMAGKTTYLRAFATALYLAHLGMWVPAAGFQFVPVQRLFSFISLSDDLRNGISYFKAEALRVKAIAQAMADGYRVVAIMDEPFKGTNVKDALDASVEILKRFSVKQNCLFMYSSHLIELSDQLTDGGYQIDCKYFDAEEGGGRLRFDYQLRSGVSKQRLGMRVLHEEGIFELLDRS